MAGQKGEGSGGPEQEELLVFGYACKLFRDDERALLLESGAHLIPWMGDETIKIDRYDGRGALYDVSPYVGGADYEIPEDEVELEALCDIERYRCLTSRMEEDAQEEEIRRFYQHTSQPYRQVGYVYEDKVEGEETVEPRPEEGGDPGPPFVAPQDLDIPHDLTVPTTLRQHAIIERTAVFIAEQGPQMEIIMKLKQSGNKQFDFLSHNDPLHPYYKHVLGAIKSGVYTPSPEEEPPQASAGPAEPGQAEAAPVADQEEEEDGGHYLHPLLASKPYTPPPQPSQPPTQVKQIVDKMVEYVARCGSPFEAAIRRRGEARFCFLEPTHPHHDYYRSRLSTATPAQARPLPACPPLQQAPPPPVVVPPAPEPPPAEEGEASQDSSERSLGDKEEEAPDSSRTPSKPTPVCFSIKKPKESEGLEVPKSALPVEESSEEEEKVEEGKSGVVGPSSPESSDDLGLPTPHKQRRTDERRSRRSSREKNAHILKERKLKVAQFLKGLKGKQ